MPEIQYVAPIYNLARIDAESVPRRISFSQLSMYHTCQKQWELKYIKKLEKSEGNISFVFGTAFHETLQEYLTTLYLKGVKQADWINFREVLSANIRAEYLKTVGDGEHFATAHELGECLEDGVAILEWIQRRRRQYFPTKNMELIGVELDLCIPASEKNPSVYWYGFIDLVLRDTSTNTIYLYDIKTSRMGWNKWQKADKLKAAQLIAYKTYFAKQFKIPVDNIEVEFFIVKRKLVEESMFPQKRVQQVTPASGTVTRKRVQKLVDEFIEECFDQEGNKKEDRKYLALAGKGMKNCKWCIFKDDEENCPKQERIRG